MIRRTLGVRPDLSAQVAPIACPSAVSTPRSFLRRDVPPCSSRRVPERQRERHPLSPALFPAPTFRNLGNLPKFIRQPYPLRDRAELTALERSEHIAEWIRLTDKGAQLGPPGGAQPNDKGIKRATKELGVERTQVQRAVKIDSITPEAKEVARQEGLSISQRALMTIAKAPAEKQAEVARQHAGERRGAPLEVDNPAFEVRPINPHIQRLLERAREGEAALIDNRGYRAFRKFWRTLTPGARARGQAMAYVGEVTSSELRRRIEGPCLKARPGRLECIRRQRVRQEHGL